MTVAQVVNLAANIRGTAPQHFAEACEVVEDTTSGITSRSAELDRARWAFGDHVGRDADAGFEGWVFATLNAIADLRDHLSQSNPGEPSDALRHTVSLLHDGTPGWVERLRVILDTGSWRTWVQ